VNASQAHHNGENALNAALRDRRDYFNARFESARHAAPRLNSDALFDFIRLALAPLATAVEAQLPERVPAVVDAGFEVGLSLVSVGIWPSSPKLVLLKRAYSSTFCALSQAIAADPQRLLPRLSNAVLTPGLNAELWLACMEGIAGALTTPAQVLDAGIVCAWRCGLAHYRVAALARMELLPDAALLALFAPKQGDVGTLKASLQAQRWCRPDAPIPTNQIAARLGAFVGLGGQFSAPPTVRSDGVELYVSSGAAHWLLLADAYGMSLHGALPEELNATAPLHALLPQGFAKQLLWHNPRAASAQTVELSRWGAITSVASTADTYAITHARSYAITLIARPAPVATA
jgi:hypothetical protein